jgi:drug/metabolite transporter (DMT)-like permease
MASDARPARAPTALHQPSGRSRLGFALAVTTMLLWGVLPLALKQALASLDAVTITWFRFGVASAVLAAFLASRRALPSLRSLGRSGWALLGVAVVGLAANFLSFLVGLDWTSPANAQVLIQLAPMLLGLGSLVVFGERYTPAQWLALAVLGAGLHAFFSGKLSALAADGGPTGRYLAGTGLLVFAAVTWAGYGLAQKQLLRALPTQALMLCIYVGCLVCFTPGAHPTALARLSAADFAVLLFCAANTLVAYGAFASALEHWEASRVSAVLAVTPLATLGFSLAGAALRPDVIQPERVSALSLAGAAAVVAGSLGITLGARRQAVRAVD